MNKEKVKKALSVVDKALSDDDFINWVKENNDSLEYEYDTYKTQCYESGEEPDSFHIWALWHYLNPDN